MIAKAVAPTLDPIAPTKAVAPTLDPLAAARVVAPIVRAEAETAEQQRHLTPRTVEALKQAGLYRLMIPQCLGGTESDPVTVLKVAEEIARADGAAAFCLMASNLEAGTAAAYLGDDAIATIFGQGGDVLMAGQGMPRGQAIPEGNGYRLSGQYGYGSGISYADYVTAGAMVMEGSQPRAMPDGSPEMRIFHVPRCEVELKDNWQVLGLRATGSFDYEIAEVYQPESFSYLLEENRPKRGGSLYTLGLIGFTTLGHSGLALGIGRRALDELVALAATKANVFGRIGDAPSFQEKFALAEAKMRAARSFCMEVWAEVTHSLEIGDRATVEQIALLRLSMRHLHEVVSEVCTFAYRAGGGTSLRESALQRCYRDIHAGTQHFLLADPILQDCGKVLLGLASEKSQWTLPGLVH